MKRILKHTILFLCILASTAQVVHLSAHIFNSHQDDNKETVHLIDDHKCSICTSSVTLQLPFNTLFKDFYWPTEIVSFTKTTYKIHFYKAVNLKHTYLRGPPILI